MKNTTQTTGTGISAVRLRYYIHVTNKDDSTEEVRVQFASEDMAKRYAEKIVTGWGVKTWVIVSR